MNLKIKWWHICIVTIGLMGFTFALGCFIDSKVILLEQNLILGFVGGLAAFIVVGNFAQVLHIKQDLDERICKIEKLEGRIEILEQVFENLAKENSNIGELITKLAKQILPEEKTNE
ncbi:MAG: hypothetical protein LBU90_03835 [Bacteroidales bacterium]|jgi:hypothetical protein|nr:hypothetical protein [Bacteroidales bacterium]